MNVAFGEATIAVDTHIFRVGNRTGSRPARTRSRSSSNCEARARGIPAARPSWLILHGRYTCKARKPECPALHRQRPFLGTFKAKTTA